MKTPFYVLFLLLFTLCACNKQSNEIDTDILIFTQQGCPHCEKAVDFINNKLLTQKPSLRITQIDITDNGDSIKTLKHYLERYNFHGDRIGTPIIIFNNQLVMGWNVTNKFKLKKAFDL